MLPSLAPQKPIETHQEANTSLALPSFSLCLLWRLVHQGPSFILLDAKGSLIGAAGESTATATLVSILLPHGWCVCVCVCDFWRWNVCFPRSLGGPDGEKAQFVEVTNHNVASPFFISGVGREQ